MSISENLTAGNEIITLSATDADEGENAEVTYHITSGNDNGWFSIDENTGVLALDGKLT